MTLSKTAQIARGRSRLDHWRTKQWLRDDEVGESLLIMVHGFTADFSKFMNLAPYLNKPGWTIALFSYDSFLGIEHGAGALEELLRPLTGALEETSIALVSHSMGGLVARYFIQHCPSYIRSRVKAAVHLGTPHAATLTRPLPFRRKILNAALTIAESKAKIDPFWRTPACRGAEQLMGQDKSQIVAALNKVDAFDRNLPNTLTISGGQAFLEVANQSLKNKALNIVVQKLLNDSPNDGLVGESSSNLSTAAGKKLAKHEHFNAYGDFPKTNHTYLTHNNQIGARVKQFLAAHL